MKTRPPTFRKKRTKSTPLVPILIASGFIFFFLLIYLVGLVSTKATENITEKPPIKEEEPTYKLKYGKKEKESTPVKKVTMEPKQVTSIPKTVPTTQNDSPKVHEELSTVNVQQIDVAQMKKTPLQMSKENLLLIWDGVKEYADTHQGRMPIDIFQISVLQNNLVSPISGTHYLYNPDVKAGVFKELAKAVIFRENQAVNGKYLCLFGNGTVLEIEAALIDAN
jgi:Na+-transporting methylmalonyl-CoA/oxaloacetate decarboxylase gamma subunit